MHKQPRYEKRNGSYYLIEKVPANPVTNPDGEFILLMADQLAIAFDRSMSDKPSEAIFMKHGGVEQAWAKEARRRYLATGDMGRQMADGLQVVVLPRDFPVEEMNAILDNVSALGAFLEKQMPGVLEIR